MSAREMMIEAGKILKELEDWRSAYWLFFPIIQKREDPFTNPFLMRMSTMISALEEHYLCLVRAHTSACEVEALNVT